MHLVISGPPYDVWLKIVEKYMAKRPCILVYPGIPTTIKTMGGTI